MKNQLRIIGGTFRGRKLSFPDAPGLRPTADRLRETLFNWLQFNIRDMICLDTFAGSGALGFEALSRGAAQVVFLDQSSRVIEQLNENVRLLRLENASVKSADALQFLRTNEQAFDLIFLDPPFKENLLNDCLELIKTRNLLADEGLVYIELADRQRPDLTGWEIAKETRVGNVAGYLLKL